MGRLIQYIFFFGKNTKSVIVIGLITNRSMWYKNNSKVIMIGQYNNLVTAIKILDRFR